MSWTACSPRTRTCRRRDPVRRGPPTRRAPARNPRLRCRLAAKRTAERLPLVPARAVPVAVPEVAVTMQREYLGLSVAPGRGGGSRSKRAAERLPARPCYLISPCFFNHAAATSLLSFL